MREVARRNAAVTEGVLQSVKLPQSPFGDSSLNEGAEKKRFSCGALMKPPPLVGRLKGADPYGIAENACIP